MPMGPLPVLNVQLASIKMTSATQTVRHVQTKCQLLILDQTAHHNVVSNSTIHLITALNVLELRC